MAKVIDGGFLRPDSGISLGGLRLNSVPRSKTSSETSSASSDKGASASAEIDVMSVDLMQLAIDQDPRRKVS